MEELPQEPKYDIEKVKEFKKRYAELLSSVDDDTVEEIVVDFATRKKYLEMKYSNVRDYAMYHALAGSSIDEELMGEITAHDFPAEDSVELFLDGLVNKYFS